MLTQCEVKNTQECRELKAQIDRNLQEKRRLVLVSAHRALGRFTQKFVAQSFQRWTSVVAHHHEEERSATMILIRVLRFRLAVAWSTWERAVASLRRAAVMAEAKDRGLRRALFRLSSGMAARGFRQWAAFHQISVTAEGYSNDRAAMAQHVQMLLAQTSQQIRQAMLRRVLLLKVSGNLRRGWVTWLLLCRREAENQALSSARRPTRHPLL